MAGSGRKNGDDLFVVLIASGETIAEAATASGMSERTAYRRLQDATVRERIREARAQLVDSAAGRLSAHSSRAAARLQGLIDSESETVALGACRACLEYVIKIREHDELAQQVRELAQQVAKLSAAKGDT